ncbi:MAG TPA: DUF2243 domain-containing protein [Actinoplanes sp.]|nr:DUF2243 domain-containing protein [Actinoplanes sp.]
MNRLLRMPGLLIGLGLGGFLDGIVLHQVLQWHHMVSAVRSPDTLPGLRINTLGDGLFHVVTWLFVLSGIAMLSTRVTRDRGRAWRSATLWAVLDQVAAAAKGLAAPDDRPLPLRRVLPSVTAVVPSGRVSLSVTDAAARCLVRPRHLRQVLINLLTNAERHAPSGTAIRLTGRTRWNRLHRTVADQGAPTTGLTRALRRTTPPADDNGLGLWLVRHLVAAQGGTLRARALVPYGLAMELNLPRRIR